MNPEPLAKIPSIRLANKAGVAVFFEVSPQAIDGWIRRGCPALERGAVGKKWVFDLLAVVNWRSAGPADNEVDPDSMAPTDRKAWYEGETKRRDLQVRDGELIPAGDVDQAITTALAVLANGIKAIPDNLERKYGIAPEVAERVELALFAEMEQIANTLEAMSPAQESTEVGA